MHRSVCSLAAIAGVLLALAAPALGQQPTAFQTRMAAWQNPASSRLVQRQAPPVNPSPSDRAGMAAGAMPSAAAPAVSEGETIIGSGVQGNASYIQGSGYDGEMIYDDGYGGGAYGGCGPACGPSCGPGCGNGCCGILGGLFGPGCLFDSSWLWGPCVDPCMQQDCPKLWWFDVDFVFGWRRGKGYPPLVTGAPDGVLPDASVLYKADNATSQMNPGMRLNVGTWVDNCQILGVGGGLWFIGKDSGEYNVASDGAVGSRVIARPFIDDDAATQDALIVAFPGLRSGNLAIRSTTETFGADAYGRLLLWQTCYGRIDGLAGYEFSRINDDFRISSNTTTLVDDGGIGAGTTFAITDIFNTRNEFHGGNIGAQWTRECCNWKLNMMGRVGLGNMHQAAIINGSSTVTVPGAAPVTTQGGLLTAGTNIGQQSRDEFCVSPEFNMSLAYRIRPCLSLSVGYSFKGWSDVLRPGDIIDTSIDTDGDLSTRPALIFNSSSFWVQSLNMGLHYDF